MGTSFKSKIKLLQFTKIQTINKYTPNLILFTNYTTSYLSSKKYLRSFFAQTLFKNSFIFQLKSTRLHSNLVRTFHNMNFFYNYMNFKKQHIWLIGSTVPAYEYGLSYN